MRSKIILWNIRSNSFKRVPKIFSLDLEIKIRRTWSLHFTQYFLKEITMEIQPSSAVAFYRCRDLSLLYSPWSSSYTWCALAWHDETLVSSFFLSNASNTNEKHWCILPWSQRVLDRSEPLCICPLSVSKK